MPFLFWKEEGLLPVGIDKLLGRYRLLFNFLVLKPRNKAQDGSEK
jgi:hypothetical protein